MGYDLGASSQKPGARSKEQGVRSKEPGARSQEQGVRSMEKGTKRQKFLPVEVGDGKGPGGGDFSNYLGRENKGCVLTR